MKTLREYMDQLDEISRRDALKYAGATAAGAALGAAGMQQYAKKSKITSIPEDAQIYFLISYITEYSQHPDSEFGDRLDQIREIISPLYFQIHADLDANPNKTLEAALMRGHEVANRAKLAQLGKNREYAGKTVQQRAQGSKLAVSSLNPYLNKLEQLLNKKLFQESLDETAEEDPIQKIDRLFQDK